MASTTSLPSLEQQWPELPFTVKATYSWSGEQRNDLGFLEGDIIEVSRLKGMWFYGKLIRNKKSGSFPANYVEIINKPQLITSESVNRKSQQQQQQQQQQPSYRSTRERTSSSQKQSSDNHRSQIHGTNNSGRSGRSSPSTSYSSSKIETSPLSPNPFSPVSKPQKHSSSPKYRDLPAGRIFPVSKSSPNIHRYTQIGDDSKFNGSYLAKKSIDRHQRMNASGDSSENSMYNSKCKKLPSVPSSQSHYNISRFNSPKYDLDSSSSSSFDKSIVSFTQTKYWESSQDKNHHHHHHHPHHNSIENSSQNNIRNSYHSNDFVEDTFEDEYPYDGSLATMSNFSATSAGSFARHKFAKSFTDSKTKQDLPRLLTSFNNGNENGPFNNSLLSLLQDSPNSAQPSSSNWFKKKFKGNSGSSAGSSPLTPTALNPKFYPELPDISQLSLNGKGVEVDGWAMVNKQLNRANTLSGKEKYERRKRFLDESAEDTDIVLEPHTVMIQSINTNEVTYRNGKPLTKPGMIDMLISDLDMEYIDMKALKRINKNGVQSIDSFAISNFGNLFRTTLERLRAIFVFCTSTFNLTDDNGHTNFKKPPMNLDELVHKSHCTPYELTWIFKKLANAVGVQCELVIGFLKTPNTNNLDFQLNHCWLSLVVNDEWRFVDVILGNTSNPIHAYINGKQATKPEDFYFLTEPLKLIHSHIPYRTKDQHIVPEIDNVLPMCLPTTFPNFFKDELKFHRFDNSLRFLKDSEVFEMSLFVENDVEIFASMVIDDVNTNHYEGSDLSLVQIKWYKQRRIVFIKAVLPPGASEGNLHIHSGPKGLQSTFVNIHPLTVIIPLKHLGSEKNNEFEFVRILPAITASDVDLYIKKPENKFIYQNYEYNFQSILQPSDGLVASSSYGFTSSKKKVVAIQSPSGKVYKYKKNDSQTEYGTWELKIKLNEVGIWTGLVTNDSGAGFASYAEWTCI